MSLRISGKQMEVGDAFRSRIEGRIGEAIDKYFDGGFSGHVTVERSGSRFSADCVIFLDSGITLQARGAPRTFRRPSTPPATASRSGSAATSAGSGPMRAAAAERVADMAYRVLAAADSDEDEKPGGLCPGSDRRIDRGSADDVGRQRHRRARHQGQPRLRVPQRWQRPGEHRLSPAGRQYRLDRHVLDGSRPRKNSRTHSQCGGAERRTRGRAKDVRSMDLSDLIDVSAFCRRSRRIRRSSFCRCLPNSAASITGLPEREIFDTILQRERLGSTGVGNGIAIPHGKLPGVKHITGVFARLEGPSISRRSTTSRSTWCFCCWRRKAPAPIISRRWPASPACCATPTRSPRCAARATPRPSTRFCPTPIPGRSLTTPQGSVARAVMRRLIAWVAADVWQIVALRSGG